MESALRLIQDMWQVPYICQFVKIFHGSLNMDLITPEELEQALLSPHQSSLCAELITKLLLKKSTTRRELPHGEGYAFDKWHDMLCKQITIWHRIYQKWEKLQSFDKFNATNRLAVKLFQELGGNPFLLPKLSSKKNEEPQQLLPPPTSATTRVRETRSQTNSLPRARKPRYADEFFENSSDFEEEEERYKHLGEISEQQRVVVIYYLCVLKLDTEEELLHELNYVPIEQQRVQPIGKDNSGAAYFYFNNTDCRIYKQQNEKFSLIAKTIDQVKELILRLQANGAYEFSRLLTSMMDDFTRNEQERTRKMLANIKKVHSTPGRKKYTENEYDDSDFSPVEDDMPRKRGPGRPRKIPLPERKPKVMPETSGNDLKLEGVIKYVSTANETVHSFSGFWQVKDKTPQEFRYLKTQPGGPSGLYSGYWRFYDKNIEENLDLKFDNKSVKGCGENVFGMFQVYGEWKKSDEKEILGETTLGQLKLERNYLKFEPSDESSCSEAELEVLDAVKPPHRLEFEEKVHLEHMRMPLKSVQELKKSLKAQEKRELRRVPFFKSDYLS
ncbi:unnamed protein product [Blepharisma stoltei]|uniref:Uncharacterized bromodomain-containing protein 10 helical domain-containing protein n=1 Tax=Blepharisma stoltei TaxID=1481888 RepID=A0AAU9JPZ0_9CILI|nr:unnamed protein product [Blepharisma stoltei]